MERMQMFLQHIKKVNCLMLAVVICFYSNAQTYKWDNVAMGGGGFVSGILTSKNEKGLMYARTDVGGAYKWDTLTNSWKPLLDWVSTSQLGFMGVESMAIDPKATNKLYMLVGTSYFNSGKTAILSSSDYGNTFTVTDVTTQFKAHGNGYGRQNGEKLQVDPNNSTVLYCGTRADGLFKSTNSGVAWSKVTTLNVSTTVNGNGISFVLIDPNSKGTATASQTIFVGVSQMGVNNLFVTKDGGTTFTAVPNQPTNVMPQRAVLASDGNMYITYANGAGPAGVTANGEPMDNGAVWKLNITTNVWTNVTPTGVTYPFSGISVDPNNPQKIILSSINTYRPQYTSQAATLVYGDQIYLTTNAGTTWKNIVPGMTLNTNGVTWVDGTNMHWVGCAEFDPFNTNRVWITSGQGVFTCDDINATATNWKFNVKGMEETVPRDLVSITGGPLVSVIFDYDGFRHTDVKQYSPRHIPAMGTTTGVAFAGTNPNTLLRVGSKMYYSTNQGTSWTQTGSMNGNSGKLAISATGNIFIHSPAGSSVTYRSIDNGTTWTVCAGLNVGDAVPVADFVNNNKFYAYRPSDGSFFISTDGAANFTTASILATNGAKIIRTVPGKEGHIWIALNGGGLARSTNSGTTFTIISGVTNCSAVGIGKADANAAYFTIYIWGTVAGVEGLFRSVNEGISWTRVNDNEHQYGGLGNGQFVAGDMNTFGKVYMSTAGRGVAFAEQLTAAPPPPPAIDSNFSIRLFPNPAVNNIVNVTINLRYTQNVLLKITRVNGTEVVTKTVTALPGTNRFTIAEMNREPAGMYILTAYSTVNGSSNVLKTVKFLKLD